MRLGRPGSRRFARIVAAPLLAAVVGLGAFVPAPATAATTWTKNLWTSSAFLYQDPYYTACTAAASMLMLNLIAAREAGGESFAWSTYRVKSNKTDLADPNDMTSILAFARRNDTLRSTSAGSDPHGWRNAVNNYGWGLDVMKDQQLRPYEDRAYSTFGGAVKAAVRAIARLGMPVGVLGWAGGHAQVIHGYVVTGKDPTVSSDFTVQWVYISDPLKSNGIVNRKTSYGALRDGSLKYRFQKYRESDSPFDDPHTGGTIRSSVKPSVGPSEWYGKWVLVIPVRPGPVIEPPPDPEPDPTPTPDPTPVPDGTPEAETTPTPEPTATVAPAAVDPTPQPIATLTPAAEPTPAAAEPAPTPDA